MPISKDSAQHYETTPSSADGFTSQTEDITLFGIANLVLRNRRLIAILTLAVCAFVLTRELIRAPVYRSVATFMSQENGAQGGLLGLAGQVGLELSGSRPSESPQFYVDLVKSREILRAVAQKEYVLRREGQNTRGTFADLTGIKEDDPALRDAAALKALNQAITTSVSPKTGIISLEVRSYSPQLARLLSENILDQLAKFNLERRQSQAAAERRFTEQRLAELKSSLSAAENRLQEFLQVNQQFKTSSQLTVERDRLMREVTNLQQVYTVLAQAYEKARIDEVRNTPVLTVIDRPELPARPESRHLIRKLLFGVVIAIAIALLVGFVRDTITSSVAEKTSDAGTFSRLKRDTISDLKNPFRMLLRRRSS